MSYNSSQNHGCFEDFVPIKVDRVFDSCRDKDCLNDVPVILDCELPCGITMLKNKCVSVANICITVEPIPFNKGFYSVDITFEFNVALYAYTCTCDCEPIVITGKAFASKKVILYGSEGNTVTFCSNDTKCGYTNCLCQTESLPVACVTVVNPVVLEARIGKVRVRKECDGQEMEDNYNCSRHPLFKPGVLVTLGLFSVVEITRKVTVLVPTIPYTVPEKQCNFNSDSPCEIFDKIAFPVDEFAPASLDAENENGCPCSCDNDCGCD